MGQRQVPVIPGGKDGKARLGEVEVIEDVPFDTDADIIGKMSSGSQSME